MLAREPAVQRPSQSVLDATKILRTIELLQRRIEERFPGSGLGRLCGELARVGRSSQERSEWIARPILSLRVLAVLLSALILAGLVAAVVGLETAGEQAGFLELVQGVEAGVNDVVFVGVAIYFLWSLERRIKRSRALKALHELRSIAHVIDMHQLTKDPYRALRGSDPTTSSPTVHLTPFQLGRYLDYCSEMLSLTGKLAVLYVQRFDDATVLASASELESLTTGLARKIWQKLMILHATDQAGSGD